MLSAEYQRKGNAYIFDLRELDKLYRNLTVNGFNERVMDEEAMGAFEAYKSEQGSLQALKTTSPDHIKLSNLQDNLKDFPFKTKPFPEQLNGVGYLTSRQRVGIFDEMGLGKTKQVLDTLKVWEHEYGLSGGKVAGGVVICPNTAKFTWTDEIKKHSEYTSCEIGNGVAECKTDINNYRKRSPQPFMFILHMDCLRYVGEELEKLSPDFVVIDEFHFFKNVGNQRKAGSQRSEILFKLIDLWEEKNPDLKIIIMTGTPIAEKPEEAYAVFQMLMPGFVTSWSRFVNRYCVFEERTIGKFKNRKKIREKTGYKNLYELKDYIESIGIRRLKSEVTGFPEKMQIKRYVVLEGEHKDSYETVKNATREDIVQLKKSGKKFNVKNRFVRLMQVVNNPALLGGSNISCKYQELDIILEEVLANPDEKVILWTIYRPAIELLYDRYAKPYGTSCIYGDIDMKDRPEIVHKFSNEKFPRVLVCNPSAAGTSLNLQRAGTAIYVDCMFELTARLQSEDRIHRRGSKGNVSIINLVAKDTIDEGLEMMLQRKKNIKDALLTTDEQLIEEDREHLLQYLK
jgi:SNF2 family DNA or RNA helicase